MLSGKERHLFLVIISLLIASSVTGQAGRIYKYHFDGNLQDGNVIADGLSIVLNYSISELNIEGTANPSGDFYRISIPGHTPSSESGKPELPVLSRLINIPENTSMTIKISDVISSKIIPTDLGFKGMLFPRQPGGTKGNQVQKTDFVIDKTAYSANGLIQSDTVQVELIGKVREKQLASLLVNPVRYNPFKNELEVISSMKIVITFQPAAGSGQVSLKSSSILFDQSISRSIINYNPADVINGYSNQPVKMIVIADPSFKKTLEPFYRWKTQKGIKIKPIYTGTGLSTFAQLKDSISKIYNSSTPANPAPEYLLIVGDVNKIPKSGGTNNTSDLYYGEFDGNGDYIPDMYIGRLPVADTNEVKNVVHKIIQYEKFQFADTNKFYTRALVTAGNDATYADFMNGQVKYEVTNYLNTTNKINGYHLYYPQSYTSEDSIKKLIKKGLGFINYTGHGLSSGWIDPSFSSADVPQMQNKNMYPFIITNACRTAQFDIPGSFGNTMVVSENNGAVGYIGCSNDSQWYEDFYWAVGVGSPNSDPKYTETGLGALDRLFHTHGELPSDWYLSMGQVNYAGNLAVSSSTTKWKKFYWETYTLLGDPSTIPFIGTPDTFKIALADTLPNGIRSLSLTIPPFAYIAISHSDTLWDASFASPSGSVTLDLPGISNDSCLIVVTGQNKIPLIKKIKFASLNKEYINLASTDVNDASSNNNGQADFGESVFLKLVINNLGTEDATGLYARLKTESNWVTIANDSVPIGTLAGNSQIVLPVCFGLTISDLVPDKGVITFNLSLGDSKVVKKYTIDICIHSPVLEILNCLVDDSGTGDGDFIAEPGETFNLLFKVRNSGSSNIAGTFSILNQPAHVTIPGSVVNTGPLQYGQVTTIPLSVKLDPDTPRGGSFDISTFLNCPPYNKNRSFTVPIGNTNESFEYQKMTIFPWINSGKHPWFITSTGPAAGQYCAQSGQTPDRDTSMLKMRVNVPVADTMKFSVKVSSEQSYDFLNFRLNGNLMFRISGETGWTVKKFLLPEGFNLLEWFYVKDESAISGADCGWLDNIVFPNSAFTRNDLKAGKIVTPQQGKSYTQEQITAQMINMGTDTVRNFNLAYQVNSNTPVYQNFNKKINPADTALVTFSQTADLAGNGTYIIKVYGFGNNDNYLLNDTTKLIIINTGIFDQVPINTDNRITIVPNPFKRSFRLDLESRTSENVKIELIGQSGKILWEDRQDVFPGLNVYTISPEDLGPGFYTVRIKGKTIFRTIRVVKIE
jgi:hypothetical protein